MISTKTISRWNKKLKPKLERNERQIKIDDEALKKGIESYPDSYIYKRLRRLSLSASWIKHIKKSIGVSCKEKFKSYQSGFRKKIYVLQKKFMS